MVNYSANPLDRTFSAISDPTRRAILSRLAHGEASVKELAAPFQMSLPAVLKHLDFLESAGLLRRQKIGRVNRCQLVAGPLAEAAGWLAAYQPFWEAKLDALSTFLSRPQPEDSDGSPDR